MQLRPQFSLRMILLLMAAVGVALAIFRWPWVERDFAYHSIGDESSAVQITQEFERRITYRRDWRGRPVKHGLEQSLRNGQVWHEANYYDGQLSGPRRVWNLQNKLAIEATYLGGKLHGPFRSGDGKQWTYVGQYAHGLMSGEWRILDHRNAQVFIPADFDWYINANGQPEDLRFFYSPLELSLIIGNWHRGKLHGKLTWQTLDGELLNTAEYAGGEIVEWNGQPLVRQFSDWLHAQQNPRLEAWLSEATAGNWRNVQGSPLDELTLKMGAGNLPEDWLGIYLERPDWHSNLKTEGTLVPALCEYAAREGLGFDYRYGALWLVPGAADPSPPFIDPTGVDKVEFAAGSSQAREWTNPIDVDGHYGTVGSSLRHVLQGTSITLDVSALSVRDRGELNYLDSKDPIHLFTRTRRDVVGLILYRCGFRCEQRGDTLVIIPRWPQPVEGPQNGPLAPSRRD